MRYVFFLCFLVLSIAGFSQVYNPIPQYVFKNKLGVGRSTRVDSSAYMNIGPNGGANAGVVLPRVADTLSILGTKRNGLLIFSLQLNKFAWWDSTGARWTEVGSGSGSSGGEVMLMNGSGTVGDSLLFSSVSGDTAYIRNLWFANGLIVENMGDTVLKVNVDSSTVPNIYNSDGVIPSQVYRYVELSDTSGIDINGNNGGFGISSKIGGSGSGFYVYTNRGPGDGVQQFSMTTNSSTNNIILESNGVSGQSQITLDGISATRAGIWYSISVFISPLNISPLQTDTLSFGSDGVELLVLRDLTDSADNKYIALGQPVGARVVKIVNKNLDATYKWRFSNNAGILVKELDGTTVTLIDDQTVYELYYDTADNTWYILNKY